MQDKTRIRNDDNSISIIVKCTKSATNKHLQHSFQEMFQFDPMERINAQDIEHHPWFTYMHDHINKGSTTLHRCVYDGELQYLYFENHTKKMKEKEMKERDMKQTVANEKSMHKSNKSIKNNMKIGYDDTQPTNASSCEFSSYSEVMNQLKNQVGNQGSNDRK